MYEGLLLRLGLNDNEAKMYELLLSRGETKARDLLEGSGLGRGNVYNVWNGPISLDTFVTYNPAIS
jgi:sugar-specific transcriptional regulator TrmB